MEFDRHLFDEFMAEAQEHLSTIEDDFLTLENQGASAESELVDKVFRAIHSVKGGASFLGLSNLSGLAHAMENLLTRMRERELFPDQENTSVLLKGVDLLREMVDNPETSEGLDTEEIRSNLISLTEGKSTEKPQEKVRESKPRTKGKVEKASPPPAKSPAPSQEILIEPLLEPDEAIQFDQYLYDEFVSEALGHMEGMEEDIRLLEDDPSSTSETADRLFRAVHSIKGGSSFLGLSAIARLTDMMEELLDRYRKNETAPDGTAVQVLLACSGILREMAAIPQDSTTVDASPALQALTDLLEGREPELSPALPETALDLDDKSLAQLMDEALSEFDYIYLLQVNLQEAESTQGLAPALLALELEKYGRHLDAVLKLDLEADLRTAVPATGPVFESLFASMYGPELIADVLELPEENITLVQELAGEEPEPPEVPAPEPVRPSEAGPEPLQAEETEQRARKETEKAPASRSSSAEQARPGQHEPPATCGAAKTATERTGTIRINVGVLDQLMTLAGELVLVRNQQLIKAREADTGSRDIVQRLDHVTTDLQEAIMRTRMQPVGNAFNKLPRIVRDLSAKLDKEINITTHGNEVELDKTILESLTDPLTHIIRNCCDHGIESPTERERAGKPPYGQITVRAYHEGGQINLEITDDGQGVNPADVRRKALEQGLKSEHELQQMSDKELISLVMLPGFSTARDVTDVSGRGVGMDVVKHCLEELGGSLELDSWYGKGTTLNLRLPLTLAIIPCLIVVVGDQRYALPQVNLEELVCLYDRDIYTKIEVAGNQEVYRLRDKLLPMVRLPEVFKRPKPFTREDKADICEGYRRRYEELKQAEVDARAAGKEDAEFTGRLNFAVVKVGGDRFGLIVDDILGTEEIVVKPMHQSLKHLKCYSGATVMGDGAVALILDIEGVARHAGVFLEQHSDAVQPDAVTSSAMDTQSILLFKSGETERFAMALPLIRRIEKIEASRLELVGDKEFITVDDTSTLVIRLDDHLNVSPCLDKQNLYLILPKFYPKPFGILISEIIDIEERFISLNTESYVEDGLLGTDIIQDHLTLFPDIFRLIEMAEPKWFDKRRESAPLPDQDKRILLLEDSAFLRHMVRKYLESDNYKVHAVEHGKEGLEAMAEQRFHLIVSDIEMPVMDGLEFIKAVRLGDLQPNIPAMALTSLNTDRDRRRALAGGFNDYLIKLDREQFLAAVARMLSQPPTSAGFSLGGADA